MKYPKLGNLISRWRSRIIYPLAIFLILLLNACTNNPARPDEDFPFVHVSLNNTTETIDDYVSTGSSNRIPCTLRLSNSSRFDTDIDVTIQSLTSTGGGAITFSSTSSGSGTSFLNLILPEDGSSVTFYVIGSSTGSVYGDVAVEVVENRTGADNIVLARKALLVTNSLPVIPSELIEVQINNNFSTIDDYLTWSPTPCRIRIKNSASVSSDLDVQLTSTSYGGQLAFATSLTPHTNTATATSLNLTLPASGGWVNFYMAGLFNSTATVGFSSTRDKDAMLTVRRASGGDLLGRWSAMVRVRKNANNLTDDERDRLITAMLRLNDEFSRFSEYWSRHNIGIDEAHGGSAFLPWHRLFVLQLERELQAIDPSVALHYWKFDEAAPNVFHEDFMGESFASTDIWADFSAGNPLINWSTEGITGIRRDSYFSSTSAPSATLCGSAVISTDSETATLALGTNYSSFIGMENNPHGTAHVLAGGFTITCPSLTGLTPIGYVADVFISPRDPLFFLLHSNVERLWAKWQWVNDRFDPASSSAYSPQGAFPNNCNASTQHVGHYVEDSMWPWNGESGSGSLAGCDLDDRPTTSLALRSFPAAPGHTLFPSRVPTVQEAIDYRSHRFFGTNPYNEVNHGMGYCYDDVNF